MICVRYELFLDESLTYSAGIHLPSDQGLYDSQMNKIDALVKAAQITASDHVLEIGCGWGSFAIRAAKTTGCKVTGITISEEQFTEARSRVRAAGLEDKVNIAFCDYRELPERFGAGFFDKAVSCEMIEAVGHEHLPTYFCMLDTMVRAGGRVAIQAITIKDHRYEGQLEGCDFIKRHIFPGSVLPSMQIMKETTETLTSLRVDTVDDIGLDYAITLKMWHDTWCKQEAAIKALGYDDIFFKKWRFYFSYCEGAFGAQLLHNYQISFCKDPTATTNGADSLKSFGGAMAATAAANTESERYSLPPFAALLLGLTLGLLAWYQAGLISVPTVAAFFLMAHSFSRIVAPRVLAATFTIWNPIEVQLFHRAAVACAYSVAIASALCKMSLDTNTGADLVRSLFRSREIQN